METEKRFTLLVGDQEMTSYDDAGIALQAAQNYRDDHGVTVRVADRENKFKIVIIVRGQKGEDKP